MKRNYTIIPLFLLLFVAMVACSNKSRNNADSEGKQPQSTVNVPQFDADSAYQYVKAQVDFGPRVPNTAAHRACGEYLVKKLEQFGATVCSQQVDLIAYDGTLLKARNIIGSYKPETKKRILLLSHWDSRPWADADPDEKNRHTPILGANDGASGVGVLLEIARQLHKQQPELGIDIVLVDAEDYGPHQSYEGTHKEEQWALGSQYWAQNPHVQGYNARFGILLDMVGAKDATFLYEGYSEEFAKGINRKVWNTANNLGYGRYFVKERGNTVTDDHLFVNRSARIPTIDIIQCSEETGFYENWHTLKDNMDGIDRNTLKAVGQTIMEVIYKEK